MIYALCELKYTFLTNFDEHKVLGSRKHLLEMQKPVMSLRQKKQEAVWLAE